MSIDIGNEITRNPGNFKRNTFNAKVKERPDSVICLTKSNMTPTESVTTVKVAIENKRAGINSLISHLSKTGKSLHLAETIFLKGLKVETPHLSNES